LERLLIELGDRTYLAGRLADLYDEAPGAGSTWRALYGGEVPAVLPGGGARRPVRRGRGGGAPLGVAVGRRAAGAAPRWRDPPPRGGHPGRARRGRADPRATCPAHCRAGHS